MSCTSFSIRKTAILSTLLFLAALVAGCSQQPSIQDVVITEESEAEIAQKIATELTVEEGRLLRGYLQRSYPDLEDGRLPAGRTLGQMIADQRAFESSSAGGEVHAGHEEATDQPGGAGKAPAPKQSASQRQPAAAAPPGTETPGDRPAASKAPQPPPPPPAPTTATVPSGTTLQVRLRQAVSSKTNQAGDRFESRLEEDLKVDGHLLAPAGTLVSGTITEAEKSGKVKGRARMSLRLDEIHPGNSTYEIQTQALNFEASGTKKKDAKRVGLATGIGAAIGAIAGGGKGAVIGTAIGAGAGTGVVVATAGENVEFEVEQLFEFVLNESVKMQILPR